MGIINIKVTHRPSLVLRKAYLFKFAFILLILGSLFTATSENATAADLALPNRLEYVNVDLRDIFRDLAETGRFRVLFAHSLQKKTTMVIESGALIKQTISEITANHDLIVKWLTSGTAVIGDHNSLSNIRTTDINLHILPLKHILSTSVAKALETIVPNYKIRYDLTNNEIGVMASSLELQNITELINRRDREIPIINMEVEIFEVTPDFLRALGITNSTSPQMKAYPLTKRHISVIERNTEKKLLARQKVTSLNNQGGKLFFGDQIPNVSEESKAEATSYQIGYVDVGTTIDYFTTVVHNQEAELLIRLQAKVDLITNTSTAEGKPGLNTAQRKINTTVGLNPGETILLTGALKRDEYMRMKSPLYEFPFLESLFRSGYLNDLPTSQETGAAIIFMTPILDKAHDTPQPESPRLKQPVLEDLDQERILENLEREQVLKSAAPEPVKTPGATDISYIVKSNDTLFGISRKFGVDMQTIININHLANPRLIKTGATLVIPVPNRFIHTVKPQETIWRLAKRYGTTVAVLEDLNSLEDATRIKTGQKLVLPVAAAEIVSPQF